MQLAADGLRVLNAGSGLSAALVTRLLGEAGAEVHHGPGVTSADDRYPGVRAWAATRCGTDRLASLSSGADVIVVGGDGEHDDACTASQAESISRLHPRAIVLAIEGYLPGVPEPTAAEDLLVQARLGMTAETAAESPAPVAFAPTLYGAALLGSLAVWAGLLDRAGTGRGQVVRTTLQQGAALFWPHLWMASDVRDADFDRVPPVDVRHLVFRCADGRYVQIVLGVPQALQKLYRSLDIPDAVDPDDRGAPDASRGPVDYFARRAPIAAATARLSSEQVVARLAEAGVPVGVVSSLSEALTSEQAMANGLVQVDDQGRRWGGGAVSVVPADAGGTPTTRDTWWPTPGREAPLAGLKVVDLGNWVAGPFAAKLLADLGADVVSVDPPSGLSHLTGVRNVLSSNRGKRSVELDLKSATGRASALALVAGADVVCHNLRVGVAERLGLGAQALFEANPSVVALHTTGFGHEGPWATRGGFDMIGQAVCGHEVRAGGEGNEPLWTRSPFIDYGTGALGAIAVLQGMYARVATGVGQQARVSLLGTGLFLRSDCYLDEHGQERGQVLLDRERRGFSPGESTYRTADGWVALVVTSSRAAAALARLVGLPGTGAYDAWGAAERDLIGRWAAGCSTAQALSALESAEVPAAECRRDQWESLGTSSHPDGDPFVIEVDDDRFGTVRGVFGPQVRLDRYPVRGTTYRSAPLPGQHTLPVLASLGIPPGSVAASPRSGRGPAGHTTVKVGSPRS